MLAASSFAREPRLPNAVERQAVHLAVAYCEGGVDALAARLHPGSPWKNLDGATARTELEVRLGPRCVGRWELQTVEEARHPNLAVFEVEFESGLEETLFFWFRRTSDDEPLLFDLRTAAEPLPSSGALGGPVRAGAALSGPARTLPTVLTLMSLLLIARWRRRTANREEGHLQPLLATLCAVGLLACSPQAGEPSDPNPTASGAPDEPALIELSPLGPLRLALASGALDLPEVPSLGPAQRIVADLWLAQRALEFQDDGSARAILAGLPETARATPLYLLLNARTLFLADQGSPSIETRRQQTSDAYFDAVARLPTFDGLLYESATVNRDLGFDHRTKADLEHAAVLGSRQAAVHYELATLFVLDGDLRNAEESLVRAWWLRPMPRGELLRHSGLSFLVEPDELIHTLLQMDLPEDPRVVDPELSLRPLTETFSGVAETSGGHLSLRWETGSLEVPGGAPMAPEGAEAVRSSAWRRQEERRVLARLDELDEAAAESDGLADPLVRRNLELAALALARENRWEDLADLTAAVDRSVRSSPSTVVNLRALALERLGESGRSTRLLADLATDVLESGRRDPTTLFQLADLLALQGRYALARKLTARAHSQLPSEALARRVRQLEMEERLAASFHVVESDHFEIRFSAGGETLARRTAAILEAERERLSHLIPVRSEQKIEVHMLSIDDFYGRYGGAVGVIGIFDGRIRVPFADARRLPPELVAVLTHELAHALISDYTHNQAPKWTHEGLAQFVEMVETRPNPIADDLRTGRYLSFPMVEDVIAGFPNEKLVAAAYDQSFWTFCYLDTRYGEQGIRKLLGAFRDGLTTESALFELFGATPAEFDRQLRDWWLDEAPRVWTTPVIEYGG